MEAGETFCARCGYQRRGEASAQRSVGQQIGAKYAKQTYQGKMKSGRTTILVCGILFTLGTVVLHFMLQSELGKAEAQIRLAKGNAQYDQDAVAEAEKELAKGAGMARLVVIAHGVLAATFYGLWGWAKSRPLPATLAALILFIAVQLIGAALEPESIVKGILVKVLILVALIGAVNAAQKYQKLQQQQV
jgi:hypothetical protein